MTRRHVLAILLATVTAFVFQLAGVSAAFAYPASSLSQRIVHSQFADVCPNPGTGIARCRSLIRTDVAPATSPVGLSPSDLQAAYALPSTSAGYGQTVAIVAAYDDPNAESDLAMYRATFGFSPCTTSNGCFRKVNEDGGTVYPKVNRSWAQEIALDLAMVSAVCPHCHLLLVEARNAHLLHLGRAVNTAVQLGAQVINNSYGASESSLDPTYDARYFQHPGIAITASAGDIGYSTEYPAASPYVTAVGGTSLTRSNTRRGWTETAWSGTGSGCSLYSAKPSWQQDGTCTRRTIADVSAVADPATGVAVYDSFASSPGWVVFGGTSVAAPLIAGIYALAGNSAVTLYSSYLYAHTTQLNDITSGTNGSCGGSYLCTAVPGYDGPTGLGTPDGIGAF